MDSSPSDGQTFYLALYGAVLGTIGAITSGILVLNELRNNRRSLRISCKRTTISPMVFFLGDDRPIEYSRGLEVKVLNNGPRPVEVIRVGIRVAPDAVLDDGVTAKSASLPKKLEFSDSLTFEFYIDEIRKRLPKERLNASAIKAAVEDAEDRWHYASLPRGVFDELQTRKKGA